jgi:4-alpha-glucanotransferase
MSHAMAERAVYSYRVLLFEKHADGSFLRPDEYPRRAIATVTTHDLPTLSGYWSASDIALRQRLALYPSEDVRAQVEHERDRDRVALLAALSAAGLEPAAGSYGEAFARTVHIYLARSSAALVALQAEDLVGMPDPVNVPGTSDEHANWQRKMACSVDDFLSSEPVRHLLHGVDAARSS